MRLKHPNLKNMDLILRSGARGRVDSDGCIEVDNEQDAQILIATGWEVTAELNDALADKNREIDALRGEIDALKTKAEGAAQGPPSPEAPAGSPEAEKGTSEGGSAPVRKPKAPRPEADKA